MKMQSNFLKNMERKLGAVWSSLPLRNSHSIEGLRVFEVRSKGYDDWYASISNATSPMENPGNLRWVAAASIEEIEAVIQPTGAEIHSELRFDKYTSEIDFVLPAHNEKLREAMIDAVRIQSAHIKGVNENGVPRDGCLGEMSDSRPRMNGGVAMQSNAVVAVSEKKKKTAGPSM